jgi:hypothetical protein
MASRGEPPVLEAYVERASPGGVGGRLVMSAAATPEQLARWQARAVKDELVSAQTRRYALSAADRDEVLGRPLSALAFIPSAQLDEQILRQRFGEPSEVISESAGLQHWLYPQRGLAVALDAKGRELLQYVPPAQFKQRLRDPLLRAAREKS